MSRLDKIRSMLQADPHDLFLRYALAMELDAAGQREESLAGYQELMRAEPPHVPSFFRAGQLLVRLERFAEAQAALRQGIEQATLQGDHHAAAEMSELLDTLNLASDEL